MHLTSEFMKNKGIELLGGAIIELEDTQKMSNYNAVVDTGSIRLSKANSEIVRAVLIISRHDLTIYWLGNKLTMKRASTEEEYFQLMCLDDTYCDDEFEKGIKEFYDLYQKWLFNKLAIGGFLEGAYERDDEHDQ